VAFFGGSSGEYSAAIASGQAIAGWRLVGLDTDRAELEANGRRVKLPVGGRLSRRGEGDWEVVSAPSGGAPPVAADGAGPGAAASEAGESAGPASDLLKKMLERRKRELGQ